MKEARFKEGFKVVQLRDNIQTEADLIDMRALLIKSLEYGKIEKYLNDNGFTKDAMFDYFNMADQHFYLIKSDGSEDCEEL